MSGHLLRDEDMVGRGRRHGQTQWEITGLAQYGKWSISTVRNVLAMQFSGPVLGLLSLKLRGWVPVPASYTLWGIPLSVQDLTSHCKGCWLLF